MEIIDRLVNGESMTSNSPSAKHTMSQFDGQPRKRTGDLWLLVRRRWKGGLAISLVLFIATCAVIRSLTPVYTASVQMVLPYMPIVDPAGRKGLAQMQTDMYVVRGYTDIFQSDDLCLSIIDKLKLADLPDFNRPPTVWAKTLAKFAGKADDGFAHSQDGGASKPVRDADVRRGLILQAYKARLKAKNDNKSLVLAVSFDASDPYLAVRIINAHVAAFVDGQIAYRQTEASMKTRWIKSEIESAAAQLRDAQSAIQLHSQSAVSSAEAAAGEATDFRLRQVLAQSRQNVYETLLVRYGDLVAEQQYVGSDIRVLSKAVVPIKPSFPKPALFAAVAAFSSLVLGFGVTTGTSVLLQRVSIFDMAEAQDVRVVGRLPIRTRRRNLLPFRDRTRLELFWESIRSIRSVFAFDGEARVLLVTSCTSGEGKSLTAASMAHSLATSGFRTLLLDMNVRRPSFYAPRDAGPDLRDYFEKGVSCASLAVPLDVANPLYFIGMRRNPVFTGLEIFGSGRMKSLVAEAKHEFDAIIVDAPALEDLADSLFLADLADEVILVAMEGRTTETSFARVVAALRARAAVLRGVVISEKRGLQAGAARRIGSYGVGRGSPDVWPTCVRGKATGDGRNEIGALSHSIAFAQTMAKRLP